jgi:TPR repeat protein
MTIFARTLDRQFPARATSSIPGLVASLFIAFLWPGAAQADLDDIRRAAEAGDAEAQLELGILFQYGFNYKDNEIPALTWYTLSANQGSAKAVKLRDTLKAKMTEKEVQEAMEQAAQYKPKGQAVVTPVPAANTTPVPIPETPEFSPAPATEAMPVPPAGQ